MGKNACLLGWERKQANSKVACLGIVRCKTLWFDGKQSKQTRKFACFGRARCETLRLGGNQSLPCLPACSRAGSLHPGSFLAFVPSSQVYFFYILSLTIYIGYMNMYVPYENPDRIWQDGAEVYRKDSILAMRQLMEKKGDLETRRERSCSQLFEAAVSHVGIWNGLKSPSKSLYPFIYI